MKNIIILLSLFTILLGSCKTQYITKEIEVPIETIKTEYKNTIQYDSIYIHDSINVFMRGDTIFKDKIKLVFKERLKNDTLIVTDTIEKPVYVTTEVEVNKLTTMQSFLVVVGRIFCVLLIIGLGFLIYKIYKKFK